MRMTWVEGILAVGVAGGLLIAAAGCDRGRPGSVPTPEEVPRVEVSAAVRAAPTVGVPASVRSTEEVDVATRYSGRLDRLDVEVGSRVRRGDTLALVDPEGVRPGVDAAAAEAERARAYWERIRALARDGAATPQELDDAEARKESAAAGLRAARARMSYAAIVAPFDGMVAARLADPGDLVVPGRPIVSMVQPASLEVVADLPEETAMRLSSGSEVTVREGSGAGRAFPARVARIAPAVDRASHRVRVELVFAEGGGPGAIPLPGAFVRLEIEEPGASALWIPADALVRRGQLTGVYLASGDGVLELRWIRIGSRRDGAVEVLAGLDEDARVVRRPGPRLADGVRASRVEDRPWAP